MSRAVPCAYMNTEPNSSIPSRSSTSSPNASQRNPSELFAKRVFFGSQGLRSGWSLALYLMMAVVVGYLLTWLAHSLPHSLPRIFGLVVGECILCAAAFVPAVVMTRIDNQRFGAYGLPQRGAFGRLFWVGVMWGIVALTVLMLALRGLGAFYFGAVELHGLRILKFGAFYGFVFLLVGFTEEFLLRGYTQFTLTRGLGFWPAAILLSTLFGAAHLNNPGEAWIGALAAALIGLFFCLTLRRTGTLWFAVGMHASWDWGETYLFSVPNSGQTAPGHLLNSSFQGSHWLTGGSVGPEGSVLVFVLIALMWVLFDRLYPSAQYPAPQSKEAPVHPVPQL